MAAPFYEHPVLNTPYAAPTRHHALDSEGRPQNEPPRQGRRRSELITPVPPAKKQRGRTRQGELDLDRADGEAQAYNPIPIINEIRDRVAAWRGLKNPADWGVTPTTERLLRHWREHDFQNQKPFFCQIEAVETAIWLAEVAPRNNRQYGHILRHVEAANQEANPELHRLALKMATGAGKTTVMAMLIAWQTLNAVRMPGSNRFSNGFLIVTPGITIRDRLRVLLPAERDNYYATRELVPAEMLGDMARARIVLTNYHAFKKRVVNESSRVGRELMQGWRKEEIQVDETEGQMLQRACKELLTLKSVVVINDEAHHCYRERPEQSAIPGEDKATGADEEVRQNKEAARLWISGLEALGRRLSLRAVYDLSATPFFLRGSGYKEGTLFPWTVSDFSLIDAIECGIVKLPRVPVADNVAHADDPIFRNLWEHIRGDMSKKGAGKAGPLDPLKIPTRLQSALYALYGHYSQVFEAWRKAGIDTPPVFIVVCNNTANSKLVYEWVAGFEREREGEKVLEHEGHLELFSNYDRTTRQRLPRPNTILVDSSQLESGDALDPAFKDAAAVEVEQFRKRLIERHGAGADETEIDEGTLLREVMNTVGRKGELGEQVRCVVSVGMLTEGWDANTVTHILGVRAFGTQLLCEQVVGRGLRRLDYQNTDDQGLLRPEYADILGIPFTFAAQQVVSPPTAPRRGVLVRALREREALEIEFPRVDGYRVDLPQERLEATFSPDSRLMITPADVGPSTTRMAGVVGEEVELTLDKGLEEVRPSEISYRLAVRILQSRFRDPAGDVPMYLFPGLQQIVRRWLDEYLVAQNVPRAAVVEYPELAERAAELIFLACQRSHVGERRIKGILDPYNPKGSTRFVSFTTTKDTWETAPTRCHVSHVVCDSDWEAELARVLEAHPSVIAYVKNQGLGFEVPYRDGSVARRYLPDFIVRIDTGGELLNLVPETKGYRGIDAQLKAETMRNLWVPGMNNLRGFGTWAFAELTDVYAIEGEVGLLIDGLTIARAA